MGASRLSERYVRRLSALTGLPVIRGWSHGGYTMRFVTADHRHGWWNKTTGEWGLSDPETVTHYTSCREFDRQSEDEGDGGT